MRKTFVLKTEPRSIRILFLSFIAMMVAVLFALAFKGSPQCQTQGKRLVTTSKPFNYTEVFSDFEEQQQDRAFEQPFHQHFSVDSYHELRDVFTRSGFSLTKQQSSRPTLAVPRLYLVSLPKDFKRASVDSKKKLFVKSLLPLILQANENILQERRKLLAIMAQHQAGLKLSIAQKSWLTDVAQKYRLKKVSFAELKKRIDIIPPSLALGQAIVESGWGTSQCALQRNATFGMRDANRYLVYDSLMASVENYMCNINRHPAYEKMRHIRQTLRQQNQALCSIKLAKGLVNYSTRGESYVQEISHLINQHNLKKYDAAHLMKSF
jgi:Bax protein